MLVWYLAEGMVQMKADHSADKTDTRMVGLMAG